MHPRHARSGRRYRRAQAVLSSRPATDSDQALIVESLRIEADALEADAAEGRAASRHQAARLRMLARRIDPALTIDLQSVKVKGMDMTLNADDKSRIARFKEARWSSRKLQEALKKRKPPVVISHTHLNCVIKGEIKPESALRRAIEEVTKIKL
jgi:hypothetical protein